MTKNSNFKPRSTKLNPKIDLTAMTSVSFLLITFYMVTIELSKPNTLELGLPDNPSCGLGYTHCGLFNGRQITLLLDDNNKIISYQGLLGILEEKPKKLSYGKDGIRKELLNKKRRVATIVGDRNRGAIVIIKPSKKCTFGNLVAVLDEMNITQIPTYTVVNDFTPEELKLLASN